MRKMKLNEIRNYHIKMAQASHLFFYEGLGDEDGPYDEDELRYRSKEQFFYSAEIANRIRKLILILGGEFEIPEFDGELLADDWIEAYCDKVEATNLFDIVFINDLQEQMYYASRRAEEINEFSIEYYTRKGVLGYELTRERSQEIISYGYDPGSLERLPKKEEA
tara:strand:- start:145 stop:639 length:495 start_codon:yes stop_codon:yes gene_type:complete